MSRSREELVQHLRTRFGENTDPGRVIDALFEEGALDDVLARRFVVRTEFSKRYSSSDRSARCIQEELADEYGLTRVGVFLIVGK